VTEDRILETQNPNQSNNQSLDVIAILADMMDEAREIVSPTPTFKHRKIGEVDSFKDVVIYVCYCEEGGT
jgi:hypothetical protein